MGLLLCAAWFCQSQKNNVFSVWSFLGSYLNGILSQTSWCWHRDHFLVLLFYMCGTDHLHWLIKLNLRNVYKSEPPSATLLSPLHPPRKQSCWVCFFISGLSLEHRLERKHIFQVLLRLDNTLTQMYRKAFHYKSSQRTAEPKSIKC